MSPSPAGTCYSELVGGATEATGLQCRPRILCLCQSQAQVNAKPKHFFLSFSHRRKTHFYLKVWPDFAHSKSLAPGRGLGACKPAVRAEFQSPKLCLLTDRKKDPETLPSPSRCFISGSNFDLTRAGVLQVFGLLEIQMLAKSQFSTEHL